MTIAVLQAENEKTKRVEIKAREIKEIKNEDLDRGRRRTD